MMSAGDSEFTLAGRLTPEPRHVLQPEDPFRAARVVDPTRQGKVGGGGRPAERHRDHVDELELPPTLAAPAVVAVPSALAAVAGPDLAADGGGDGGPRLHRGPGTRFCIHSQARLPSLPR